ncbi:hypothetical protein ACFL27_28975 [candidate division CSSED10-310 bacterium]|uniref:Porin n=1 Tax=candidate division CSSED10-310 bacterium TaxID=2855610 RepID=A0ABV6Z723_UNCC1
MKQKLFLPNNFLSPSGFFLCIFFSAAIFLHPGSAVASEEETSDFHKSLHGISFGFLAYLDYSNGDRALPAAVSENYNSFRNTRGYFTVKKKILPWMGMRVSFDIHQDDTGDYKVRHKYLYVELKGRGAGFFTDLKSEAGMGHMPWLDFEEHINPYRCQGTMAIERAGTFNSADLGVSLRGYFGGHLEDAEARTGTHYYTGKWGSWHFGVYNGGGYHAPEKNENKVLEGRITLRPLPYVLPGLQFSALGIFGQGNVAEDEEADVEAPDYNVNIFMVSFEHPRFVATAQYYMTEGNAKGAWIDADGEALKTEGYSVFGKVKMPFLNNRLSLWGRFDHFDANADDQIPGADDATYDLIIGSATYDFYNGNLLLLGFETTEFGEDSGGKKNSPEVGNKLGDESKFQVVWQIKI